jgi:hypothetical protein
MATNKTAPAPAKAAPAKAAAPAAPAAPAVPLFTMGPWPAKARAGNSIRAYCYGVAAKLHASNPNGFTLQAYASALAGGLGAWQAQGGKVPSAGFGTAQQPNGAAMAHANWFANAKQGWLSPAPAGK